MVLTLWLIVVVPFLLACWIGWRMLMIVVDWLVEHQ